MCNVKDNYIIIILENTTKYIQETFLFLSIQMNWKIWLNKIHHFANYVSNKPEVLFINPTGQSVCKDRQLFLI